ncbi:hypothetical protein [Lysobacter sp. 1R34A]|uniref:hypothetical protein n=1 Tax=Lysobacter sp. 1R34A TaxID=3445786 RepID=UPI003EEABD8B
MAGDDELVDAALVVIAMKGSEGLVDPDDDIEPAFAERHARPEFPFELDLLC